MKVLQNFACIKFSESYFCLRMIGQTIKKHCQTDAIGNTFDANEDVILV